MTVREMLEAVKASVQSARTHIENYSVDSSSVGASEPDVPDLGFFGDVRPDESYLLQQALQKEVVRKVNAQWRACVERL